MPAKIFVVQGDKSIGGLESEINKWQQSLGWTDGYAEDGCGPVGVPELEYLFGWSGQWGPIFIQPKGDPKCHRCVCA